MTASPISMRCSRQRKTMAEPMINATVTTLDNGIRVVTVPMPHVQSAAAGVLVGVGGRHESAAQSGISHFIEHLLFKGTETLSATAISRAIEGRGAFCEAFTQEEETCFFVKTPAARLDPVFKIITEMYLHPRFDRRDIERERDVILDEIMMYRDQPDQMVEEILSGQLFPRHPLGRTLAGNPAALNGMRREDLLAFKNGHYVPANTVFAFAGRIEPDVWIEKTRRQTAALTCRTAPRSRAFGARSAPRPAVVCVDRKTEQSHLALGFRTFGRHDPRRYALQLLNIILGESMNSRLFQTIRERHGLVYAIGSGVQFFHETGELVISAGADPARIPTVMRLVIQEIKRLRLKPVRASELRRACDYAAGQILLSLESTSGQMMWAAGSVLHLNTVISPEHVIERFRSVTTRDVQQVAGQLLQENNAAVALVGPDASTRNNLLLNLVKGLS